MMRQAAGTMLALAGLCAAGVSQAAPVVPPDPAAAQAAFAAYDRNGYRYAGILDAPDLAGHLLVALSEAPDGTLSGEALLLGADRTLRAASAVHGRLDRQGCRIAMSLDPGVLVLDGTCTPALLAGRFSHAPPPQDLLARVFFWWGGRSTHGEAWLPAGGAI